MPPVYSGAGLGTPPPSPHGEANTLSTLSIVFALAFARSVSCSGTSRYISSATAVSAAGNAPSSD